MIIDGPPFASGKIHYGTLYNKYLKQILQRINNKKTFPFFFDTHGLPIENKLPRGSSWIKYKNLSEDNSKEMLKDLALYNIAPDSVTLTCNKEYCSHIWSTFNQLFKKQLCYEKNKILLFCPSCSSICSNNELEIAEIVCKACYYKLYIDSFYFFLVFTTQPWTLRYNEGIAYNANTTYLVTKEGLIASQQYFKKNSLRGVMVDISKFSEKPFCFAKKIVSSVDVELSKGTGLVHLSPNYGLFDYNLLGGSLKEVELNYDGTFIDNTMKYQQLNEFYLNEKNCYKGFQMSHRDFSCWRCKTPCLRKRIKTIFLRTSSFKKRILSWISNKQLVIYPEGIKNKFTTWIENIQDWGVARQRKWGVQIPLWRSEKDSSLITLTIQEYSAILKKEITCSLFHNNLERVTIGGVSHVPINQILDVWFDSACLSSYLLEKMNYQPIYAVESIDQVRGWYYGSAIINAMLNKNPPWKKTYCHGYLLKNKNEKFSKSSGNIDLSILNKRERRELLFYLSNRNPWKNSIFDLTEAGKSNKALSILENLSKIITKEERQVINYDYAELDKLIYWFFNLGLNFEKFSTGNLVSFIITFSRNYVNKNKHQLDRKFMENILYILKKMVCFILLEEEDYHEIKNQIRERRANLSI